MKCPGSSVNQEQAFLDNMFQVSAGGGQVKLRVGFPQNSCALPSVGSRQGTFEFCSWASVMTQQPPSKHRLAWHFTHRLNPSLPQGVQAPNAHSIKKPVKSNERTAS